MLSYSGAKPSIWKKLDWFTVAIYLVLIIAGWITICGASYNFDINKLFQPGERPFMQLIWMGFAVVIGFVVIMIDSDLIENISPLFYFIMLLVLAVTIFVAPDIKGSHSWLVIGPMRLQPAEFAKVSTALLLAWQVNKYQFQIKGLRNYSIIFAIVITPMLLILLQSETGSALVFTAMFLALYREGFSGIFLGIAASAVVFFVVALMLQDQVWWGATSSDLFMVATLIILFTLIFIKIYCEQLPRNFWAWISGILLDMVAASFIVNKFAPFDLAWVAIGGIGALIICLVWLAISYYKAKFLFIALFSLMSVGYFYSIDYVFHDVLQPHQQGRVKVALGIDDDIKGKGYNVDQSKIAIGSGGLMGKGFLQGTQTKLNYVPEQATDFIFCTVGEEQGFLGSAALLITYAVFILRLIRLAERQTYIFGRVYGYSVASIFLFHLTINIGMVIGLIPVIGIPLPFFSYGGSSLWGFTILLFIFLGMDARRK